MDKTINSFFAGFGGFDLGFQQAGFTVMGAWDNDPYAIKSYTHNLGDHIKLSDITLMKGEDIPVASGWLFGFPCTDISYAGRQAGMIKGETRSGLFYEVMRLLEEVDHKPEWILAENVKAVEKLIPEIEYEYDRAGYKLVYTMYNSKYFTLPQSRERYFLLGVRKDLDIDFVFPEQDESFVPRLSSALEETVDERFFIESEKAAKVIEQARDKKEKALGEINVIGHIDIKGHDLIKRVYDIDGVSPTLNTTGGGNQQPKILIVGSLKPDGATRSGYRDEVWDADGLAGTLTATDYKQPRPILHEYRVRKLTPREYARLQGFPSTYEQVVSNSRFYKGMGNAVSVPVAFTIAQAIREQL
jgi:DNA (cytosine-5)-methyltransferase 1